MLPVAKGEKRTYIQSNIYLVLLILSSFLFLPLSLGLTIVSLVLGVIWLCMSIAASKKQGEKKWANIMFGYSLFHMMAVFGTVFIYATVGMILNAL